MDVIFVFPSLSFYYGLDMFLATRDVLVINGSSRFFTSSGGLNYPFEKYAQVNWDTLPRIRGQQQHCDAPLALRINGENHWVVELACN